MKKSIILDIIVWLYVLLFLYTGISKLLEYGLFKGQITESPILAPLAPVIAGGLPFVEFIVALMLIIPRWRLKGVYVSTALMAAFTFYILAIITFNDRFHCNCGGLFAEMSWSQHIGFNSVFILLGVIGIILEKKERIVIMHRWEEIIKRQNPYM